MMKSCVRNSDGSDNEEEIFFKNNSNVSKSSKTQFCDNNKDQPLRLNDFSDECEIMPTEADAEEASMRKFVIFLEKNGYIRKTGLVEKAAKLKDKGKESYAKTGKPSDSEVTIYKRVVTIDFPEGG